MTAYLTLGAISAISAFLAIFTPGTRSIGYLWCIPTLIYAVVMIGFRHEIGGDWFAYLITYEEAARRPFFDALLLREPGYMLANIIPARLGLPMWGANLICAVILCTGVYRFAATQPIPAMVVSAASPYLLAVVGTGYTRQAAAIGLLLIATDNLLKGRAMRYLIWCVIAATFHKTAVLYVGIGIFAISRRLWISVLAALATIPALYLLFLAESVERLQYIYIEREYHSSGALLRALQLACCGMAYLILMRRRGEERRGEERRGEERRGEEIRRFWTFMSIGGIATIPAVLAGPSSTMVDRIGLYLLPLQIHVLANIALSFRRGVTAQFIHLAVAGLNLLLLLIWLATATRLDAFIPFKSYL